MARRQAAHRGRLRLHLGVRRRSGHRRDHHRDLQGRRPDREARRPHVKIVYKAPNPAWFQTFGGTLCVIPKHVFEPFKGAKSREAPANLKPVGTGPYRIVDFKPGDAIRAELNPNYHEPNWPFFDRLELKGGGDAVSAARAVIQTGEYDFAWNIQVEDDVLRRMEQGGKGGRTSPPPPASSTSSATSPIPGPRSTASAAAQNRRIPS